MAKRKKNYDNVICCICGSRDTYIYQGSPKWYTCICGKEGCTRFLCNKCYMKQQNDLPDSHKNLRRDLGDLTKISITTESGTGIFGECVIANILGIRNCDDCTLTKKNYDWSCPHDLEKDGRKIQVKARIQWYGQYSFSIGDIHNFNILYILCLNRGMKNIRRIYVIPDIKISDKKGITIYEDSSTGDLYEEFRVEDIKQYNDAYNYIMERLKNCRILKL